MDTAEQPQLTFPRARPILKLGDPRLRESCKVVTDFDAAQEIIGELCDTLSYVKTLHDFHRGCGLAAPQIGHLVRIAIIDFEGVRRVLINPRIVERSEEMTLIREGCLSFFNFRGMVSRHTTVTVEAENEHGDTFQITGAGDMTCHLQHELDHLDGVLYIDRLANGEKDLFPCDGLPEIP